MHTTFSDGHYSPSELLVKVKENNINIVAITDHDSVNALEDSIIIGKKLEQMDNLLMIS